MKDSKAKLFVKYPTALKAKEKGFNEECLMVFYGTTKEESPEKMYLPSGFGKVKNSHLINSKAKGIFWKGQVTAILYQQLFDWLLKKGIIIRPSWHGVGYELKAVGWDKDNFEWFEDKEKAIDKAFKMI